MASVAVDGDDKLMAVFSWTGLLFMGPVTPGILLAVNWRKPGSLARRHAGLALTLWLVHHAILLPVMVTQLMIPAFSGRPPEPGIWVWVVAGGMTAAMLICSVVGAVSALRADRSDLLTTRFA